jgi:hypothetical protein
MESMKEKLDQIRKEQDMPELDFKSPGDGSICGVVISDDDEIIFSSCNLKHGCQICGYDLECPRCGEEGYINGAGGVSCHCGY